MFPHSALALIFENDVQGVNDSGNVTSRGQHVAKSIRDEGVRVPENREEDVDQEISSASAL